MTPSEPNHLRGVFPHRSDSREVALEVINEQVLASVSDVFLDGRREQRVHADSGAKTSEVLERWHKEVGQTLVGVLSGREESSKRSSVLVRDANRLEAEGSRADSLGQEGDGGWNGGVVVMLADALLVKSHELRLNRFNCIIAYNICRVRFEVVLNDVGNDLSIPAESLVVERVLKFADSQRCAE